MKFLDLEPDTGMCRLCCSTVDQYDHGPEKYIGTGQVVRRCGQCAFVYLAPDFTDASLNEFYTSHYRRVFPEEILPSNEENFFKYSNHDKFARIRIDLLREILDQSKSVLDIGSGFGSFLGALGKIYPKTKLFGQELDVENRSKRLDGATVNWINNDFDGQVDLVTIFHTLEHVTDPISFIENCHRLLSENGMIVIEVPDLMCDWKSWKFFHAAHLSYFTPSTMRRALECAGFEVVHCGENPGGKILDDTIWAIGKKLTQTDDSPRSGKAEGQEIKNIDLHISRVSWGFKDQFKSLIKDLFITFFGAKLYGKILRYRRYSG